MTPQKDLKYLISCERLAPLFSTCGKRQYYSFILSAEGRVVGTGYNGGPAGVPHCNEGGCPRFQENSPPGSDYDNCIAIHAEENALLWSDPALRRGGTLYVNGIPCHGCAKKIANSGVARLVYIEDDSYVKWSESKALLEAAGIECIGYAREGLPTLED